MAVLAGQAAMRHQCAVDLLDHPPLGLRDETLAPVFGVAADDLDVDVHQRPVDDDLVLEALIHQGLLPAHPAPFGGLVKQGGAGLSWVEAAGTTTPMISPRTSAAIPPLAARHLLVGVQSRRGLRDTGGRANGLGVDDHEEWVLQPAGSLPRLAAQEFLDRLVEPVLAPQAK
ncbi:hypothetical protein OHA98_17930 [Streptomyces sp. NBC_00654]|uniref:hypothetical protein n=1 Tax=Streptomyces sp. NBC_00654 TaxID=2975799 RepID=UPI002256FCF0|nr:hypothetical protein [Streptomyces sp. NBC_00654]MCX4966687.1 hypothetical protein [Streptomyces sp. NBC_00654]